VTHPAKLREHFALTRSTTGPEGVSKVTVKFTADPLPALQSAVTEILYATLKPGADLQALAQTVGKAVIGSNSPASPAVAAVQGSVADNPETIVLVIGWNSYEDFVKTFEGAAAPIIEEIGSRATLDPQFYRLNQVQH